VPAPGSKAPDFKLPGVDGKTYSLADVRGRNGTVVAFICNHCPYVRAIIGRMVAEAEAWRALGIGTIAIMPNDTESYREDSFDNMKAFAARHSFGFPYVIEDPRGCKSLRRTMHAGLLRVQRTGRAAISRQARCIAYNARPQCTA
jgi:peroxiredoxin